MAAPSSTLYCRLLTSRISARTGAAAAGLAAASTAPLSVVGIRSIANGTGRGLRDKPGRSNPIAAVAPNTRNVTLVHRRAAAADVTPPLQQQQAAQRVQEATRSEAMLWGGRDHLGPTRIEGQAPLPRITDPGHAVAQHTARLAGNAAYRAARKETVVGGRHLIEEVVFGGAPNPQHKKAAAFQQQQQPRPEKRHSVRDQYGRTQQPFSGVQSRRDDDLVVEGDGVTSSTTTGAFRHTSEGHDGAASPPPPPRRPVRFPRHLLVREGNGVPEWAHEARESGRTEVVVCSPDVMDSIAPGGDGYFGDFTVPDPPTVAELMVNARRFNAVLVIDNVTDPGRLGAMLRSAAAFQYDAVFIINHCADLYDHAVMRASQGVQFLSSVPIYVLKSENGDDVAAVLNHVVGRNGLRPVAYTPRGPFADLRTFDPKLGAPTAGGDVSGRYPQQSRVTLDEVLVGEDHNLLLAPPASSSASALDGGAEEEDAVHTVVVTRPMVAPAQADSALVSVANPTPGRRHTPVVTATSYFRDSSLLFPDEAATLEEPPLVDGISPTSTPEPAAAVTPCAADTSSYDTFAGPSASVRRVVKTLGQLCLESYVDERVNTRVREEEAAAGGATRTTWSSGRPRGHMLMVGADHRGDFLQRVESMLHAPVTSLVLDDAPLRPALEAARAQPAAAPQPQLRRSALTALAELVDDAPPAPSDLALAYPTLMYALRYSASWDYLAPAERREASSGVSPADQQQFAHAELGSDHPGVRANARNLSEGEYAYIVRTHREQQKQHRLQRGMRTDEEVWRHGEAERSILAEEARLHQQQDPLDLRGRARGLTTRQQTAEARRRRSLVPDYEVERDDRFDRDTLREQQEWARSYTPPDNYSNANGPYSADPKWKEL